MRIGRDLKLVGKVESVVFHAETISYATFKDNVVMLSQLKKELAERSNLMDWAGNCYLFFCEIFENTDPQKSGKLSDKAQKFISELGRGVYIIDAGNKTQIEMAIEKGLIDEESVDEIYGKLLFFALNVYMPLRTFITTENDLKKALAVSANCQTTLLSCMDFIEKQYSKYFSTSIVGENTGESPTA